MYICERARETKLAEEKLQLFSQVPSIKNNGTEFKDKKKHTTLSHNLQRPIRKFTVKFQMSNPVFSSKEKQTQQKKKQKERKRKKQPNTIQKTLELI